MLPRLHRKDAAGSVSFWSGMGRLRNLPDILIRLRRVCGVWGPGHFPQVSLLGFGPGDGRRDFPAQKRLFLRRSLLALSRARSVGFMLPKGDWHGHPIPPLYRTPDPRVGIGDVDPADVPGVVA